MLTDALEQPRREQRVVRVGDEAGLGLGVKKLARHDVVRLEPPFRRHQLGRTQLEQAKWRRRCHEAGRVCEVGDARRQRHAHQGAQRK